MSGAVRAGMPIGAGKETSLELVRYPADLVPPANGTSKED
jgi:hypothetical protein